MKQSIFRFEFLVIIAIIGLFAGIFLVSLYTAHTKARVTAYMSYAEQAQRLIAGAVASGYVDDYVHDNLICLGGYGPEVICEQNQQLNVALSQIGALPQEAVVSPYNDHLGVGVISRTIDGSLYFEVRVGISSDIALTKEVCDDFGWGSDGSSYCYIHIKQSFK